MLKRLKKLSALLSIFVVIALLVCLFPASAFAATGILEPLSLSGGNVTALYADGTYLYAATYGGGVYRSADEGGIWEQVKTGLGNLYVLALYGDGTYLYAGTVGGVYRSDNKGNTWEEASSGLTGFVYALYGDSSYLYAGTMNGAYRSDDQGENWEDISGSWGGTTVWSLYSDGTNLYAGVSSKGVYWSKDFGANWTEVNTGLGELRVRALYGYGTDLYAAIGHDGVYQLVIGQTSWTFNAGFATYAMNALYGDGTNLYAVAGGRVHMLVLGQSGWTGLNTGLEHGVNALCGDGTNLYAGTDGGGVYKLVNGQGSWVEANGGLNSADISEIVFADEELYIGTSGGIHASYDQGITLVKFNEGLDNPSITAFLKYEGNLLAGVSDEGIYRYSDVTGEWEPKNTGLLDLNVNTLFYDGDYQYAGTQTGLARSADNGDNWETIGFEGKAVHALYLSGQTLYAGVDGGMQSSTNHGASWIPIDMGGATVRAITEEGNFLFVGTDEGIYRNENSGGSGGWDLVTNGLTCSEVTSLYPHGGILYAGTTGCGIFMTINNGENWIPMNTGLTNLDITALDGDGTYLYVGTAGGGAYRMELPQAPTVGEISAPTVVKVGQKLSLTIPEVLDNGDAITAQGWQLSANGSTGWAEFDPAVEMTNTHNGQFLRYYATNSVGTGYSPNIVQITIGGEPTPGDTNPTGIWVLVSVLSLAAFTGVVAYRRRQRV